jgi:hypothetical protein
MVKVFTGGETDIVGNLVALAVPWSVFMLYRLWHTQQVFDAGYGIDDLRAAMRQQLEQRKEELAFEYDREPPLWARIVRGLAWSGVGLAVAAAAYVWATPIPSLATASYLFGTAAVLAVGGGLIGRLVPGRRLKARDSTLEYRLKIFDSKPGRLMQKLATIGLKPKKALGVATHRPTEVAIGMAADQIFDSLTKGTKKQLRDLPALVRRLEAEAQGTRARVDELQAMIAGLGDEALAANSLSLKGQEAGAAMDGERERLRRELTEQRDQASQRLSVAVAALENIRLDLLRLKAGVGTVDQLTSDLNAARNLQAEIEIAMVAKREVEAAMRAAPPGS